MQQGLLPYSGQHGPAQTPPSQQMQQVPLPFSPQPLQGFPRQQQQGPINFMTPQPVFYQAAGAGGVGSQFPSGVMQQHNPGQQFTSSPSVLPIGGPSSYQPSLQQNYHNQMQQPQFNILAGPQTPQSTGLPFSSFRGHQSSSPQQTQPGTPQPLIFVSPSGAASSAGASLSSYPTNSQLQHITPTGSNMMFLSNPSPTSSLSGFPTVLHQTTPLQSTTTSAAASLSGYPTHQARPPPVYNSGGTSSSYHLTPDMSRSGASMFSTASTSMTPNTNTGSSRVHIDNSTWGYAVVDPLHPRLQRVPVPPTVLEKTQGVISYERDVVASSAKPCLSAVCLKHNMPEGCSAGAQCPNFHVSKEYLDKARKVWDPLCCAHHNCYFSQEMEKSGNISHILSQRFVLIFDRAEVELCSSQLAFTVGLEQLPLRGGNTRVISGKSLCRLHFDSKCKWTKDCSHVHVCRDLFKFLQAFHYPSLSFLLMTETDEDKIVAKIESQKMVVEFLQSSCSEPLVNQLQENGKQAALSALRRCRVTEKRESAPGSGRRESDPVVAFSEAQSLVNKS